MSAQKRRRENEKKKEWRHKKKMETSKQPRDSTSHCGMNVLMYGETIPRETLYGGLNKWSIELTRLSQRSVAVSHSIIHIAVSYGNSTWCQKRDPNPRPRAGSNGSRLVQAITDNNASEIMNGLNKTVPVLMAGHGFMMEDIIALWISFLKKNGTSIQGYLGYTKSDALNGVNMFNYTVSTVPMSEAGAVKYLFTKFALRGIGGAQFEAAIHLNYLNTDWARMAVTAMNHRGHYTEVQPACSKLRIKRMRPFKTDTADMQRASEIVGTEQTVVRFDVKLEGEAVEKMQRTCETIRLVAGSKQTDRRLG